MLETLDVSADRMFLLGWALEGAVFCHWKLSQIVRVSHIEIKMKTVPHSTSVQNIRSIGTQHLCRLSCPDCPKVPEDETFGVETCGNLIIYI